MNVRKIVLPGFIGALFALFACYGCALAQTPDPGLAGPHAVTKAEYNLGYTSYTAPPAAMFSFPMEEIGSIHYPTDLSSGPFPVVLFLHGRHETCYDTNTKAASSYWPCTGADKPIPSYEGYDYLAENLASNGYIVISISANCINANDAGLSDAGMNARGVLTQHHLDLWNKWNTTGGAPFGTTFVGKLDMKNIGTMGHSRGGEGVIYNAEYNRSLGSPYGIRAIFTLAPVDFYRHYVNGIPLVDLSPYCDGDVSDNEGVHFFDDARYADPTDTTPKHTITMMGANHNFFNKIWSVDTNKLGVGGGADDWGDYGWSNSDPQCGVPVSPRRFDTVKQRAALNAYLPGFFRLYLGNETKFAPIFDVNDITAPASTTLADTDVYVSYHPGACDRLDLNRVDKTTSSTTNTLTGSVSKSGITSPAICGGYGEGDCFGSISLNGQQEPHWQGLSEVRLQWADTSAYYQNQVPVADEDISYYKNLLFRATVDFSKAPSDVDQDFTVQIIDSAGDTSSQAVSSVSHALYAQPGTAGGDLPKMLFNTINIPMSKFTGVDLTKVRYVRFRFNRQSQGAIAVSDIAFANPICGRMTSSYTNAISKYKVTFTNNSTYSNCDAVSWHWDFGDPGSGVKDTSTLQTPPVHTYTNNGTYTVCLAITSKRTNGLNCTDTFCQDIVIKTDGVPEQQLADDNITIVPNPARDYLQITGAESTDVLRLIDLYGQVVYTATLRESTVHLPQTLATGIYYAVITTEKGNVYKKLLITR